EVLWSTKLCHIEWARPPPMLFQASVDDQTRDDNQRGDQKNNPAPAYEHLALRHEQLQQKCEQGWNDQQQRALDQNILQQRKRRRNVPSEHSSARISDRPL